MCVNGSSWIPVSQIPLLSKSHLYPSNPVPFPIFPAPYKITVKGADPVAGAILVLAQSGGLRFGVGVGVLVGVGVFVGVGVGVGAGHKPDPSEEKGDIF